MVGYKDFPTPGKDFLTHYTALWATCKQVGITARIVYIPVLVRDGTHSKAYYSDYKVVNQQTRKEVISNGYSKEKESAGKKTSGF